MTNLLPRISQPIHVYIGDWQSLARAAGLYEPSPPFTAGRPSFLLNIGNRLPGIALNSAFAGASVRRRGCLDWLERPICANIRNRNQPLLSRRAKGDYHDLVFVEYAGGHCPVRRFRTLRYCCRTVRKYRSRSGR